MENKRIRRHKKIRAKISGTGEIPRLCVFRSNKHIYAQLVDDEKGITLVSASDFDVKSKVANKKSKTQIKNKKTEKNKKLLSGKEAIAYKTGQFLAKKALDNFNGGKSKAGKKLEKIVFDRGGYKYHGRVKALAEGARKEGLKF